MKEKLTKFQTKIWKLIESNIKKNKYKIDLTCDDEFIITVESKFVIKIFPKKEISVITDKVILFNEDKITEFVNHLDNIIL